MTNEVGFTEPTSSEYRDDVAISTTYAILAIRLGIESTTDADLLQLRNYQNSSTLTTTQRSSIGTVPSLSKLGDLSALQTVEGQLEFTANLIPFNPIQVVSDRSRVEGNLAQAGISGGRFVAPAGIDLDMAQDIANESMIADVTNPENTVVLNNGWTMPIPSYQGNYGVHYAVQAVRATSAFQTQTLALYPNQPLIAGSGLDSSTSLLLTFSGKPPLLETGFWNMAAYNADLGLIANPLDRYGIGSRVFNITYANGESVYGPGASAEDKEFQILVQDMANPPPSNWTGNWLPVGDGFSLTCKFKISLSISQQLTACSPRIRSLSSTQGRVVCLADCREDSNSERVA